jgi:hypothetical protein
MARPLWSVMRAHHARGASTAAFIRLGGAVWGEEARRVAVRPTFLRQYTSACMLPPVIQPRVLDRREGMVNLCKCRYYLLDASAVPGHRGAARRPCCPTFLAANGFAVSPRHIGNTRRFSCRTGR